MIKVLVVDDSLFMRTLVSDVLNKDPEIKVVATARKGEEALEKIAEIKPDVVTLDFQMPEMDGLEILRKLMAASPTPTVMLSAHTEKGAEITLECLRSGAIDYVLKPSGELSLDIAKVEVELIQKIKTAAKVTPEKLKRLLVKAAKITPVKELIGVPEGVVAIGASTGGPAALETIFSALPQSFPVGVIVIQHLPAKFTTSLSTRLDRASDLSVSEAREGDAVSAGAALVAPGGFNTKLRIKNEKLKMGIVGLAKIPKEESQSPSIDMTMVSAADIYKAKTVGVILTGMGDDGLEGARAIKKEGGAILVQDEATSVVFGMGGRVTEAGLADEVLPLEKIPQQLVELVRGQNG